MLILCTSNVELLWFTMKHLTSNNKINIMHADNYVDSVAGFFFISEQ